MQPDDFEIVADEQEEMPIVVGDANPLLDHFKTSSVSISLKYYNSRSECWSDWQKADLKGFTKIIEMLSQQSVQQLKSRGANGTPKCRMHKGPSKTPGYKRPTTISEDIDLYEIGVTNQARIHGFFAGTVFFLVWLDRRHRVFP